MDSYTSLESATIEQALNKPEGYVAKLIQKYEENIKRWTKEEDILNEIKSKKMMEHNDNK